MRHLLALTLLGAWGCAQSHVRGPVDAAIDDAPARDAGDAAVAPRLELPSGYTVWDAVATVDGEVCLAGIRHSAEPSPLLPDVRDGDAFVACFTPSGPTRVRALVCPGARFGAHSLAANAAGDLFALVEDACTPEEGMGVLRLDRALAVRAQVAIATTGAEGPFARALGAAGDVVVVAGGLRTSGRVGDVAERQGPFVAVLAADDLRVLRLEAGPPRDRATLNARVSLVAVREGGVLFQGDDLEDGTFEPSGGPFVGTLSLPGGALASIEPPDFEPMVEALWHPDGRPVVLGQRGALPLGIQVGGALFEVDLGHGGEPNAAFHGDHLLVTAAVREPVEIVGRTFTRERDGGFVVALDPITFAPRWARGLAPGHRAFLIVSLRDGSFATVGTEPTLDVLDGPGMRLTFHR